MTLDTIFDIASLTKVVATTTAVMALVEDGRTGWNDCVSTYISGFERYRKDRITVRHLLTHVLVLRPDLDLGRARLREELRRRFVWRVKKCRSPFLASASSTPTSASSCLGTSSRPCRSRHWGAFLQARVFGPLGMADTMFLPSTSLWAAHRADRALRAAGLAVCRRQARPMLRGVVHDPTARRMGGVAGHAGLFSTGDDRRCSRGMILGRGGVGRARGDRRR